MYDKKLKEYEDKKYDLEFKIRQLSVANKNYYITANTILSIAQRASEIFESSEPEEKRQLLNFLFQNFRLDGQNLLYKLKTPFKTMLLVPESENNHKWGE